MFIVITNNPYINYTQVEYECSDDGINVTTSTIISGTNGKMFQLTAEIVNEEVIEEKAELVEDYP